MNHSKNGNHKELINESIEIFRDDHYDSAHDVEDLPELIAQKFHPMFEFERERLLTPINGHTFGRKEKKREPKIKVVTKKNTGKENPGLGKHFSQALPINSRKQKPTQHLKRESEKIIFQPTVSSTPLKSLSKNEKGNKAKSVVVIGRKYTKPPASIYPICPIVQYE